MSILIFLIVLYVLLSLSMMKLFEKAGIPAWKALVPGVAAVEWCKMVGRKPWFALWLLVPVVNFFIYAGLCIDMVRSFGRFSFWQSVLAVVYAPIPFFLIGRNPEDKYQGPVLLREREYHRIHAEAMEKKDRVTLRKLEEESPFRKSALREWAEAIIFAVFAAALIRMFIFEAYVIPTPSMEGTLKVGDFLFVSKPSYGLRLPMTVVQFPLIHNRFGSSGGKGIWRLINLLEGESYLEKPALPYKRLPGWESVERNKPVVFNLPVGDSVVIEPERSYDVAQWRRLNRGRMPAANRVITRPLDKKDHYIKRCVAVAGDSIQIRNGQLYINGAPAYNPPNMQYTYKVTPANVNRKKLDEWGVVVSELGSFANQGYFNMNFAQVEKVKSLGATVEVAPIYKQFQHDPTNVFPNNAKVSGGWTVDDYGPIYIPKAGVTVTLNEYSLPFYLRIIDVYENNDIKVEGGKIYVNGTETSTYTFKQDYYWMMGDNRHNSEDSRIWGYVPADHIVGKPVLIWFSTKNGSIRNGINWDRLFKLPGNM